MFIAEEADTLSDTENSMFALKPDDSTPLQPIAQADRTDLAAPSLTANNKAAAADSFRQAAAKKLGKSEIEKSIKKKEDLARRAHFDVALQKLVTQSLRQRILTLLLYTSLSGLSRQRHMYNTMRRDHF